MTGSVIPFPSDHIVRESKTPAGEKPRYYRCECGGRLWFLETSGAVKCGRCNQKVALVVRPFTETA